MGGKWLEWALHDVVDRPPSKKWKRQLLKRAQSEEANENYDRSALSYFDAREYWRAARDYLRAGDRDRADSILAYFIACRSHMERPKTYRELLQKAKRCGDPMMSSVVKFAVFCDAAAEISARDAKKLIARNWASFVSDLRRTEGEVVWLIDQAVQARSWFPLREYWSIGRVLRLFADRPKFLSGMIDELCKGWIVLLKTAKYCDPVSFSQFLRLETTFHLEQACGMPQLAVRFWESLVEAGVQPYSGGTSRQKEESWVREASTAYELTGQSDKAIELLRRHDLDDDAMLLLGKLGRNAEAAQIASEDGKLGKASDYWWLAGQWDDAIQGYIQSGRFSDAVDVLESRGELVKALSLLEACGPANFRLIFSGDSVSLEEAKLDWEATRSQIQGKIKVNEMWGTQDASDDGQELDKSDLETMFALGEITEEEYMKLTELYQEHE